MLHPYRFDANRSTVSLPSGASPGHAYMSLNHPRSRTPSSYRARTPRSVDRGTRISTDQSMRSASLTSIVEMYQRPVTSGRNDPSLRSTGSLYYDYSEEFENVPPLLDPASPLCPIPQRAGSLHRPMVLRAEDQKSLDEPTPDVESAQKSDDLPSFAGIMPDLPRLKIQLITNN